MTERRQLLVARRRAPRSGPGARRATSSRKTRSTGASRAVAEDLVGRRLDQTWRARRRTLSLSPGGAIPAAPAAEALGFRACQFTFVPTPATTPKPASSPATRSGPSTSPRRSSTTSCQRNGERGMLGLLRNVQRQARLRAVERDGLPLGGDRDRGARPARRQEDHARRHLRRPPARPDDGRPRDRARGDRGRLDRVALRARRAARADGRLRARPRGGAPGEAPRQARPRRPDRVERRLLPARIPASRAAGRTAASSPSRWRLPCCSRSARSARSRPAAC